MTITGTATPSTLHRAAHARLGPDRQVPRCIPLILDIVWRPLKVPISESSTSLNLLFQAAAISAQLCVREVLAADFKIIQYELIRDVAAILGRFLGRRLYLELPPFGNGERATELVIVGIVERVIAVATVDDGFELSYAVAND